MKNKKPQKPKVHKDLQGYELTINEFGQITSSLDIDKLNAFLNRTVDDQKLTEPGLSKQQLEAEQTNPDEEIELTEKQAKYLLLKASKETLRKNKKNKL